MRTDDQKSVYLNSCHGGNNQKWFYDSSDGEILNGYNGYCLDVSLSALNNGDDKPIVLAYSCHGGDNQKWTISGNQIKSQWDGRCLDYVTTTNNLILYDCHDGNNQKWSF